MCAHTRDGIFTLGLRFRNFRSTQCNFQRCVELFAKALGFWVNINANMKLCTHADQLWARALFFPQCSLFSEGQTYLLGKTHFRAARLVTTICVLVLVVVTEALVVINIRFLCMESTSLTACSQTFTQQDKLRHRHHQGKESVFKKKGNREGLSQAANLAASTTWLA